MHAGRWISALVLAQVACASPDATLTIQANGIALVISNPSPPAIYWGAAASSGGDQCSVTLRASRTPVSTAVRSRSRTT